MDTIQIALVDDHRLFRSGIASLINNFNGYNVLFEAANGEEMTRKISPKFKPDIILLDINMPVMNGTATAQWLRKSYPEINIIVLSMLDDAEKVLSMLRLGVKGYLLKDSEPFEFEQALQKVAQGEVYYPEFVTRLLVDSIHVPVDSHKLHIREIEFLRLASTELTYKEIADLMNVSTRTVDGYRDTLFEKLNVKSRIGLVLYAIKNKLINL
ncbi:MAG TPA: DNA-binding response regulator [Mucilaginibacter sp.]|jgi:DNA-binding NarL/FixJ family response regulator|nr:DNA-binding response regulator [Mucilaginibacter sp.]